MRIVALLTICAIAALAPLAYADPPDPTWINGLWDDNDYDNVVAIVYGTSAVVGVSIGSSAPTPFIIAPLEIPQPRLVLVPIYDAASPRAPPPTPAS